MAYKSSLSTPKIEESLLSALKTKKIEYNITQDKSSNYASLEEAISAVDDDNYKVNGIVLTYFNGTSWVSKRYNGNGIDEFSDKSKWSNYLVGKEYESGVNGEVFNDYENNVALGKNSHIEGESSDNAIKDGSINKESTDEDIYNLWNSRKFSLVKGQASHVEGKDNLSLGDNSHINGMNNSDTGMHEEATKETSRKSIFLMVGTGSGGSASAIIPSGEEGLAGLKDFVKKLIASGSMMPEGFNVDESLADNFFYCNSIEEVYERFGAVDSSTPFDLNLYIPESITIDSMPEKPSNPLILKCDSISVSGPEISMLGSAAYSVTIELSGYENDTEYELYLSNSMPFFDSDVNTIVYKKKISKANNSTITGLGNEATNDNSTVEGQFNYPVYDSLFSIGDGSDNDNRSNSFVADKRGNIFLKHIGGYEGKEIRGKERVQDVINKKAEKEDLVGRRYSVPPESVLKEGGILFGDYDDNIALGYSAIACADGRGVGSDSKDYPRIAVAYGRGSVCFGYNAFENVTGSFPDTVELDQYDTKVITNIQTTDINRFSQYSVCKLTCNGKSDFFYVVSKTETSITFNKSVRDVIEEGNIIDYVIYKCVCYGTGTVFGGDNVSIGSHVEGIRNLGAGLSHVEGQENKGYSLCHVEGMSNVASGSCSHAEGLANSVSGKYSHVEGHQCKSKGETSHCEGDNCESIGNASHAEGRTTKSNGEYSHSEGYFTVTYKKGEHAEGLYNKSYNSDVESERVIHSVGMSEDYQARKNAHEIKYNGDHYVYGVGGYDGTNPGNSKTLQEVINKLDNNSGTDRPLDANIGYMFFDTSLNKPIWHKGDNVWVDYTGSEV